MNATTTATVQTEATRQHGIYAAPMPVFYIYHIFTVLRGHR